MKRKQTENQGVYVYDNGMIGTADLPDMLKTFRGRVHHQGRKLVKALANIKAPVCKRLSMRDQLKAKVH